MAQPHLDLPPVNLCPSLSLDERKELARRLQRLGEHLHFELPGGTSDEALAAALAALDRSLGTAKSRPGAEPLRNYGPLQRQIRVLLWKRRVAAYNTRGLNTVELLERLEERLHQESKPAEKSRD